MKRIIFSFVVVTAIAISAVVVTSCGNAQAQGSVSAKAERWEYKILEVRYSSSDRAESESALNSLGAEGWELVSAGSPATGNGSSSYFYGFFKRRLQ